MITTALGTLHVEAVSVTGKISNFCVISVVEVFLEKEVTPIFGTTLVVGAI